MSCKPMAYSTYPRSDGRRETASPPEDMFNYTIGRAAGRQKVINSATIIKRPSLLTRFLFPAIAGNRNLPVYFLLFCRP